ncbi:MAG: hypothetical protein NTW86_31105 [Candidatus Sumerlaeota bacterium]|nr:hypothetical protein [Candidatus Sumerlaeota bacterium]
MFGRLLSRFFAKPRLTKNDPIFGQIEYERGVWAHVPQPDEKGFMVTIYALETGPSDMQRQFFEKLLTRLSDVEREAKEFMLLETRGNVDASSLDVYAIEVGGEAEVAFAWFAVELTDSQADEIHRVEFRGNRPVSYGIDD